MSKTVKQIIKEVDALLDFAGKLKEQYTNPWYYVRNMHWDDAGLGIQIDGNTTTLDIAEGIVNHERVVGFLRAHCLGEDADKKYYYPDGCVKYYQVLDTALEEETVLI